MSEVDEDYAQAFSVELAYVDRVWEDVLYGVSDGE